MKQSNQHYLAHAHESPERRNRRARYTEEVNTILYLYWDPIGGGVPLDEYESYAELIVFHGSDDAGNFRITNAWKVQQRLMSISEKTIGLRANEQKCRATANILFERYGFA